MKGAWRFAPYILVSALSVVVMQKPIKSWFQSRVEQLSAQIEEMEKGGSMPLSLYVENALDKSAKLFEASKYDESLADLELVHSSKESTEVQKRYIRALCLYRKAAFSKAISEFNYVTKYCDDERLLENATIGIQLCTNKSLLEPYRLTHFSSSMSSPAVARFGSY